MYQPIADRNDEKICALMNLYKRVYWIIGTVVFGVGIILVPFIPYFINDIVPPDVNIYILYSLYLSESVLSYWLFAYKNCLLTAFQKNYIALNVSTVMNLLMYVLQLFFLFFTKNYYLYIVWKPFCAVLINIVTSFFVDKKYPQYKCKGRVDKHEIIIIKKQVIGLMAQRLAFSSRNAFDSIVISSYLGLTIVGIYNNYFYLLTALTLVMSLVFTSMQGGIGNSIATETEEKNYLDFRKINFIYMCITGWVSVCLAVLIQTFMELWVGDELMLPTPIAYIFAFYFYLIKMTDSEGAYIAGTGIWWRCKYTYFLEALVNLILNFILGALWGVLGVLIASVISVLFINFLANGIILFKDYFRHYNVLSFIRDDIYILLVSVIAAIVTTSVTRIFPETHTKQGLLLLLIKKGVVCCCIPIIIFVIMLYKSKQFKIAKEWIITKVWEKNK